MLFRPLLLLYVLLGSMGVKCMLHCENNRCYLVPWNNADDAVLASHRIEIGSDNMFVAVSLVPFC